MFYMIENMFKLKVVCFTLNHSFMKRNSLIIMLFTALTSTVFADFSLASDVSKPDEFIQQDFDVIHYDARLDFTKAPARDMIGECTIKYVWTRKADDSKFYFHLRDLTIDSVFYNELPYQIDTLGTKADANYCFRVNKNISDESDTVYLKVYYHGTMQAEPGSSKWGGVHSGSNMLYAMGVGFFNNYVSSTQHWLPCYDHPSDKATFKGTFYTIGNTVAGNGIGTTSMFNPVIEQYDWETNIPTATYLLTFAVGKYQKMTISGASVPIEYYYLQSDSANTYKAYSELPPMIAFLESKLGKYPFEKVGYVNTPIGSMEHQTMISFDVAVIRQVQSKYDAVSSTVLHELSHQWFGNSVSPLDFREAWLNEAFATFSEALWAEHKNGKTGYLTTLANDLKSYWNNISSDGVVPLFAFPRKTASNYPGTIYNKGAVVVGMLRYELGDTAFFHGLRAFLDSNRLSTATTENLKKHFEAASGKDLTQFFDQWVYSKGYPKLDFDTDITGEIPTLKISQVQADDYGVYTNLPVEISYKDLNGNTKDTILVVNAKEQKFEIQGFSGTDFKANPGLNIVTLFRTGKYTSILSEQAAAEVLSIYPQPATNRIQLISQEDITGALLKIVDNKGQVVEQITVENILPNVPFEINLEKFSSGIYYIDLKNDKLHLTKKLILQK